MAHVRAWTVMRMQENLEYGRNDLWEGLLKDYCKEQGYEVVGHSDLRGSFKTVCDELERIANEQDIDVIVVPARKLISRDPVELIKAMRTLEPHLVSLEYVAAPHQISEFEIIAEEAYKDLKGYKTPWGTVL